MHKLSGFYPCTAHCIYWHCISQHPKAAFFFSAVYSIYPCIMGENEQIIYLKDFCLSCCLLQVNRNFFKFRFCHCCTMQRKVVRRKWHICSSKEPHWSVYTFPGTQASPGLLTQPCAVLVCLYLCRNWSGRKTLSVTLFYLSDKNYC